MPGKPTVVALRRQAVLGSLLPPTTLARAIGAAGFVQADPIRAPARAQDLILRHRVAGYRAGDLERRFARLGLEEDFLYAYGFMPRDTFRLLHPRDPATTGRLEVPADLAAEVLAFVRERGPTHPADLEERFGRERAVNGWGGLSKATTRVLHSLHYHGLLRVAGRRQGIRVYEAAVPHADPLSPEERSRRIVLLVLGILAPLAEPGLAGTFGLLGRGAPGLGGWRQALATLVASGEVETGEVDRVRYYWPAGAAARRGEPEAVRLLRGLVDPDPVAPPRHPQQAVVVQALQRAGGRLGEPAPAVHRPLAAEALFEVRGMRRPPVADEGQHLGGQVARHLERPGVADARMQQPGGVARHEAVGVEEILLQPQPREASLEVAAR